MSRRSAFKMILHGHSFWIFNEVVDATLRIGNYAFLCGNTVSDTHCCSKESILMS